MSKHRLLLDDDYEFLAFGLSCHWKDYRVAWLMNRSLRMEFRRETLEIDRKSGPEEFAKFVFKDEANRLNYVLISNHNDEVYLYNEFKQYDYFLLIEGYIDIFDASLFKQRLRSIDGIQYISEMDDQGFKDIQFFIFED